MKRLRSAICIAGLWWASSATAVTITIVNMDGPGEGFNDTTSVAAEGGNPATTRGQQRLNVFQAAANTWGAKLQGTVPIRIRARFNPFPGECDTGGGVLGSAGPADFRLNFAGAPIANTWYPIALAQQFSGSVLAGVTHEIEADFNSDVDLACLGAGSRFWYGTTQASPSSNFISLLPVVLHEIGHGLGFLTIVCVNSTSGGAPAPCGSEAFGSFVSGFPDIWTNFLANAGNPALKWRNMSDAQRAASIVGDPNTVWTGPNVTAGIPTFLPGGQGVQGGFVRVHAPSVVSAGSSISHFSSAASPNLLMEPTINSNLFAQLDLTPELLRDIGWSTTGAAANQAPTISGVTTISVTEDVASSLTGIAFADADAAAGSMTATFAVPTGSLTATSSGGVTVSGTTSARVLAGTLTALNTFISGGNLRFTTAQDATTSVTMVVLISDNGNTGTGGALTATRNVTLTVSAINDAPGIAGPAAMTVSEDVATSITGFSFSDLDAGIGGLSITMIAPSGTLSANSVGNVGVGGSGTGMLNLNGTLTDLNAYFLSTPPKFTTALNSIAGVTLSLNLSDNGNTGGAAQQVNRTLAVTVTAVNDAPVVSAPSSVAVKIVGSSFINGIAFSDVDAGAAVVTASFTVGQGTLSATAGGGVTVAGNNSAFVTMTGTLSALNGFLGAPNLAYTPAVGQSAGTTLNVLLNDDGNSGSGGAQSGSAGVSLVLSILFLDGFE